MTNIDVSESDAAGVPETPKITLKGIFQVDADAEAYEQAMRIHDDWEYVAREMGSIVLVEALVEDAAGPFDASAFGQAHTGSVAYAATYLDTDTGAMFAEGGTVPQQASFVVIFYLHFYEPGEPLETPNGPVAPPPVTAMPGHLAWKRYVYRAEAEESLPTLLPSRIV